MELYLLIVNNTDHHWDLVLVSKCYAERIESPYEACGHRVLDFSRSGKKGKEGVKRSDFRATPNSRKFPLASRGIPQEFQIEGRSGVRVGGRWYLFGTIDCHTLVSEDSSSVEMAFDDRSPAHVHAS